MNEVLRFNYAYHFWEIGYWFISKFGRPMWKHLRIASSFIPVPLDARPYRG